MLTLNFRKMEQYALIMRHEDGSKVASPEQIQTWMKQTMDWIGGIAAQGKFVSGTGLVAGDRNPRTIYCYQSQFSRRSG